MTRLLTYVFLFGAVLYFLSRWNRHNHFSTESKGLPLGLGRFRSKKNPREAWVQVYETASMEEGRNLQARLQEEEVECVLYEQGKKDIHGNSLKGIGIAVPKTAVSLAQNIISRMLV